MNKTIDNATIEEGMPIETHPFEPFIPEKARMLMLGTFPPKPEKWNMPFYYPNRINDFWRVMGVTFYENAERFWDAEKKAFRINDIKNFLIERGIALSDTAHKVRRLKDNASDKYLEIVEPVDLQALLDVMPECRYIVTTGEKAAETLATLTSTTAPRMGESTIYTTGDGKEITIYRMPSTSRAYPLALEKKAAIYGEMMKKTGML